MAVLDFLKSIVWFVLDALCIIVGFLPSIVLNANPKPYLQHGIDCLDRTYKFPYKDGTLDTSVWVAINVLPAVLFGLGEITTNWSHFNKSFYKIATAFLFGSLCNNSLAYMAKYYVGEPRPDFISVCTLECKMRASWIADPVCNAMAEADNDAARLSFYSYHASHGMYYMVFTAFYVQARMAGGAAWTRMVRPTVQLNLVLVALWVGYTRVYDDKNHLNDVLIGMAQGALLAFLTVRHVFPDVFKLPDEATESEGDDEKQPLLDLAGP